MVVRTLTNTGLPFAPVPYRKNSACSLVTPEELADAMVRMHHGYNNGISHYIEAREGYDRLLDLETYGAKIRDTDDEFAGADFRDDATKLMFAYDYVNRFTLRVWGTTFKRAMYRGAKILKANVIDRTMGAGLLTEDGRVGGRYTGGSRRHRSCPTYPNGVPDAEPLTPQEFSPP